MTISTIHLRKKSTINFSRFFNSIDEFGLYSYFTPATPTPTLLLPQEADNQELAEARQHVEQAEQKLADAREQSRDAFQQWLKKRPQRLAIPNLVSHFSFDQRVDGKYTDRVDPDSVATTSPANVELAGKVGKAIKLTGDDAVKLTLGNFSRNDPFSISLWMNTPDIKDRAVVFHRSKAWDGCRQSRLSAADRAGDV